MEKTPEISDEFADILPLGVITIDRNGNILKLNKYATRLFEPGVLPGKNIRSLVDSQSMPVFDRMNNPDVNSGCDSGELQIMTGREGVCHVSCSVHNPDDAGNSILFLLDITHSKLTEERFSDLTGKLRDLSGHIESGMEAERKRLAREIHDGLGSSLSALKMELSVMKRRLKASTQPEVIPVIENGLEAITGQIDSMVDLVRKLVTELRPGVLDELGLLATVRWFAADFQKRTGLEVAVNVYPEDFSLDPNLSTAIFRILQEVMTNIQKHAAASRVVIFLRKQNHQFQMRIRDDGIGIGENALNNKRSFGIIGMQERIRLLRGKLSITGEKDKGTTVFIEIPIEKP